MKKRFIVASLFLMNCTGVLQADSTPTMSRVYGDQFTPQVAATQAAGSIGVLDTTFDTDGSLSLTSALSNPQARAIQALSDGTFVVALSASTSSILQKYNAQGTIATTAVFGTNGVTTLGAGTTAVAQTMMVDTQGRILVAGGDDTSGTAGWLKRVSADGDTVVSFVAGSPWRFIGGLAEQTTGNIIAVGSNGTNAMIARYTAGANNTAGTLDTTFGNAGYIVFDGTNGLTSTTGLYSVVVDSSNNIYVAYLQATAAKVAKFTVNGALDTTFDGGAAGNGIVPITYLDTATAAQMRIAIDSVNDLVIAAKVAGNVNVTSITSAAGTAGTVANFTTAVFNLLYSLVPTSDGKILLAGSVGTTANMIIMRLTSAGALDTATFNTAGTPGYNLFNISTPSTTSTIQGVALAPNGQIYTTGYQVNAGTTVPYVSRLYNDFYVSQVAQFPLTTEQGNLDLTFGTTADETYAGVVTPFNGTYGSSLMQQATSIIEVTTVSDSGPGANFPVEGNMIVGMNGFTDGSASSSMMLTFLDSDGVLNTNINTSGYVTLTHDTTVYSPGTNPFAFNAVYPNEYLTSMLQGQNGTVYASGYASAAGAASSVATLRAYTGDWANGNAAFYAAEFGTGYTGLAVGTQAFSAPTSTRILFFVQDSATTGHISGYTSGGTLDTSFGTGTTGSVGGQGGTGGSGKILTTAYTGLNMGPVYGGVTLGVFSGSEDIVVAYKNSSTGFVDVARFLADGSGLNTSFGPSYANPGIFANVFSGLGVIQPALNNVRVCFTEVGDIIVAAVSANTLYLACIDPSTGDLVTSFSTDGLYSVPIDGATSLQLKQATGVSTGQTLVTMYDNAADDTMYVARITSGGVINTTFNAQGLQPGVLPVQIGNEVTNYTARVVNATLVQSTAGTGNQGNIVFTGYESVTAFDSTPMVMRTYGASGSTEIPYYSISDATETGTLADAIDLDTLLGLNGGGTATFVYPSGNTYQGKMLVGTTDGTDSRVSRIDVADGSLDTSFGTAGTYTINGFAGLNSLTIDKNNKVLVTGTTAAPAGWARQLPANADSAAVVLTMPAGITAATQILQQQSGRYIVAGKTAGLGVVMAFQDKLVGVATTLVVDPTFNPLAVGTFATAGTYTVGTLGVYSIAINTDDTILAAYATAAPVLAVDKITANGSGLVAAFGTSGTKTTTIAPSNSSVCRVGIDSTGKVVVAASTGTSVLVQRFTSTGATDGSWNTDGSILTISNLGTAGVTLACMMQTTTQQTVLLGYNTAGGNGRLFAGRLTSAGALDATWNATPIAPDTAGVLTYASGTTPEAATINAGAITINGTIASIGSSNGTSGDPILTFIYGDSYVTQFPQQTLEAAAGTLDLTIPGSTAGALPLATLPVTGAITGVPQRMYIYNSTINSSANGAMLIASVSGGNTVYISQLNADLTLNTNFGGGDGVLSFTPNSGLTPTAVVVTDMYVANGTGDTLQPIYVTGYTTTAGVNTMFAAKIVVAGGSAATLVTPVTGLSATTASPVSGCVRQSSNSKVFVSGYNGTTGIVAAYNSAMTAIDTSFGNGTGALPNYGTGYYTTGVNNPIVAMTTDNSDRIYIAYKAAAGTINIDRLLANGTGLDTSFNNAGTQGRVTMSGTAFSATQIKLAIDLTNSQIIVAAVDTVAAVDQIKVARFTIAGTPGTAVGTATVAVASKNLSLSDLFIDNDNATNYPAVVGAYPNIYVVGTNVTDAQAVVARIATTATTIALDTTYAATGSPAGVANLDLGALDVVTAGALDPDRRVYMVGSNTGATLGYMGRFYGDYYWTQASPAILQGLVGTIDLTLYPNYTGGLNLAAQTAAWTTALPAGYTARAIIENQNADGTSYIAFGNGTNLIVGQVNADMIPVATGIFGTNGLTTPLAMATVNSITIDAAGNVCVAGTNAGAQKSVIFSSIGAFVASLTTPTMTVGTRIAQQKSGRYIVGGYNGTAGTVSASQNISAVSATVLPVDTSFGPASLTSYYSTGINAQIDDLVIDSQDYIYITYRDSGVVYVEKITADGSGKVSAANSPVTFNAGARLSAGITATQPARIAINSAGNILVGATTASGVQVSLINGSAGTLTVTALPITAGTSPVLTGLVGSGATSGSGAGTEFYGSIYDTTTNAIAFAVTGLGAVDTAFGSSGYLNVGTATVTPTTINGISVQADGKVVMVGGNATPAPVLLRGYGYPYIAQFQQDQNRLAAGILDTTLWPTTGALKLDDYAPISTAITNAALSGSTVSRIHEYANGNALLVFSGANSGADTIVARILKDLTLDTVANGGTGFNTVGYITITGKTNANALYVDRSGNIFVAGGTGATSWVAAYNSNGSALTGWTTPTSNLANGAYQIAEQTSNRKILAGKGSTNGTLYGYTIAGALDSTFGSAGVVDMGSTSAITGMAIDVYDDIITVSTAGTTVTPANVLLRKVTDSGGTITTLSGGTVIANSTGSPKVILDSAISTANIVVASATTAGFTIARYNNDAAGTDNGTQVQIVVGGSGTSVLGNIYATSDGKVVLIGYETATDQVVVVRLLANFTPDTTFGYLGVFATTVSGIEFLAQDGMICLDDTIMLAGGNGASADPYLVRSTGDAYVTYVTQAPAEGVAGTIDPTWGSTTPPTGIYNYSGVGDITANSTGQAILPLANGGYYMALTDGTDSQLIRTVAEGTLDTSFGTNGIAAPLTGFIANSIMMDGSGRLVLTDATGKVARFVSGNLGTLDTSFGTTGTANTGTGIITIPGTTIATAVVEQTLGRYVITASSGTNGFLYAYTSINASNPGIEGILDTTFNAGDGGTPGYVQFGSGNPIYNVICDQYDRLIFTHLNNTSTSIVLYRLTPTGELDATFGTDNSFDAPSGKVTVFSTTTSGSGFDPSCRVAFDSVGNIVVAAYVYDGSGTANIKIAAYDNGTATTINSNGILFTNGFPIPNVVALTGNANISLTGLATTADGKVLVLGNSIGGSSTLSPTWIARLANTAFEGTYALDTTFNPDAINGVGTAAAGIAGIFEYSNTALGTFSPYHVYNDLTVRPDGRLAVIGYEQSAAATFVPTVLRVYDNPYTTETIQTPNSKAVGTNDITLGVSATAAANLGITFFGTSGGAANYGQVARAIALQNDNNLVVAIDGGASNGGASQIFIDMFDTDGLLNQNFSSDGMVTVLSSYAAQNVQDMVTFTTVDGLHKAILAGYVTNATLGSTDSLLLQCNLGSTSSAVITPGLDTSFGGFNGNPEGIAFGDGKQLNVVGRQSNGRIIAGGQSQDNLGLLLGYTADGKMDTSFGSDGYLVASATSNALFTHAIDTQNRVVIAYRDTTDNHVFVARFLADGSGLDTSFNGDGLVDTGIVVGAGGNNNMRIALDSSNNVVVAMIASNGTTLTIRSYSNVDGLQTTTFAPSLSLSGFTLSRLLIDIDGKAIIVGSDTNGETDYVVIARTTTAKTALDTTFNTAGAIPGCLKYIVAGGTTQQTTYAMIHPDGRILIVGSEN